MTYQIELLPKARRQIKKLDSQSVSRIIAAIETLADNPRPNGAKKLRGTEDWRIRVGNYRVIYSIEDDILQILILTVSHRREAYR